MSDAGVNFEMQRILQKPEHRTSSIILIPPTKQWTSGNIYHIHKADTEKGFDTNANTYLALLQVESTQLASGKSSPATSLFHCPVRGNMQDINRSPINASNDGTHLKH